MTTLKTEINTPGMERRILRAGRIILRTRRDLCADFEHGQWWITNLRTRAQYSVVDAAGGRSVDGFDLEQITDGDKS